MAAWRLGRGWTSDELASQLEELDQRSVSFQRDWADMTPEKGWNRYFSEAVIARERPGPPLPDGPFHRMEVAVANFQFSDPGIVVGHFDARSRLLGRRMLLEMTAVRVLHYLAGVVVSEVRFEEQDGRHVFGFRYDTLDGHLERGSEWFLLTKNTETGEIAFRIEAAWLPGDFPNWWSRLGFKLLGADYQRRWHHSAHRRLYRIAHDGMQAEPQIDRLGIAHAGPAVTFSRTLKHLSAAEPRWEEKETIQSS